MVSECCNPFGKPRHDVKSNRSAVMKKVTSRMVTAARSMATVRLRLNTGMHMCTRCYLAFNEVMQQSQRDAQPPQVEITAGSSGERRSHVQADRRIAEQSIGAGAVGANESESESDQENMEIDEDASAGIDLASEGVPLETKSSTDSTEELVDKPNFVIQLNKLLDIIKVKPIIQKNMRRQAYCREKMKEIMEGIGEKVFGLPNITVESADQEMLQQLKEKFAQTSTVNEKILILSLLPLSWSAYKIRNEFSCSKYLSEYVKKLVKQKGIMCGPEKYIGNHVIDPEVLKKVEAFFLREDISSECPGKRQYITVNENNEKIQMQRRLLLMNLDEAYAMFKEENVGTKIGFTKFTMMRPPQVILALSCGGIHSTCVCAYHQNVKLVFEQLKGLFIDLNTYRDLFSKMLCDERTDKCYMRECDRCSGVRRIEEYLGEILHDNAIHELTITQWVSSQSK